MTPHYWVWSHCSIALWRAASSPLWDVFWGQVSPSHHHTVAQMSKSLHLVCRVFVTSSVPAALPPHLQLDTSADNQIFFQHSWCHAFPFREKEVKDMKITAPFTRKFVDHAVAAQVTGSRCGGDSSGLKVQGEAVKNWASTLLDTQEASC